MLHGSAVEFCLLMVEVIFLTLIGGGLLRASCALFNLLAGSTGHPDSHPRVGESATDAALVPKSEGTKFENSAFTTVPLGKHARRAGKHRVDEESSAALLGVPKPSYEWAMCIFFVVILVNVLCCFILSRISRLTGQATGLSALRSVPILLVCSPLFILKQAGMNAIMLPTSFGKGLLIALILLLLRAPEIFD
ncbi:MAG: hypothetical protein ACYC3I_24970 [Gemmataceae bacterium]